MDINNDLYHLGSFMYSEIIHQPYELEECEDFIVNLCTLKEYPQISLYINIETGEVIDIWYDNEG